MLATLAAVAQSHLGEGWTTARESPLLDDINTNTLLCCSPSVCCHDDIEWGGQIYSPVCLLCLSVSLTEELSSYLANRVPETEPLTDAMDYDQDFY